MELNGFSSWSLVNIKFKKYITSKMVEKMRKYKEHGNNALSLKWGKIRIFLEEYPPMGLGHWNFICTFIWWWTHTALSRD